MAVATMRSLQFLLALVSSLALVMGTSAAQTLDDLEVPRAFKLDLETAAKLRPALTAASSPASNFYPNAVLVFGRLTEQAPSESSRKLDWQLRIVEDGEFNAYSSPDGSIFVESGLARLAGASSGLWAAILSHEIAHVIRRDWARRYLYEKGLRNRSGTDIVLGDPGLPSESWANSEKASADLGLFCRRLELEADREGLTLMARAGYHPDFMPALHHLLHAETARSSSTDSPRAMHPRWEQREHELNQAYVDTSIEFERRWHEWYATPGGNPPVLVFAEAPTVKKIASGEWEIKVPLRCQNLSGAVEVVVHSGSQKKNGGPEPSPSPKQMETRQMTGCTSPRTTITFLLSSTSGHSSHDSWSDVYVLDAWGQVLARADLPKLH